jgi:Flp pilus assembly protein TadG
MTNKGWATLELVILAPLIIGLIGVLFYFGQLAFLQLHMTSVTDAAARIASIKDCGTGEQFIKDSFPTLVQEKKIDLSCSGEDSDYVTMSAETKYISQLPFFDSIDRTIHIEAKALNEKKLNEDSAQ